MPAVPSLRISGTWKTTVCGLFFLTFAVALGVSFSSFYAARDLFEPYIPPDVPDKVMQPPYVLQMPTLSTVGKQCTQPTKDRPNYYVCQCKYTHDTTDNQGSLLSWAITLLPKLP